ncbi:aspartate aminotransferase [Pyrodictium delaneyi]|nr:aspartate aminotransferase [Pyrodictium delaneyi]
MTPGPTVVDPDVLLEMARPTMNHVSPEFDELHRETLGLLGRVFGTGGRVILFPGSGTAAMELAVRSVVGPGDRVLVLRAGVFGDYLAEAARSVGARVDVARVEPGKGFTASMLEEYLSGASYSAVLFQHVDTSTSVANPVAELARVARRHGARVVVDGVASIGGMEMRMDEWGVDVCFTGSQKALSTPPGLAIVAFREGFEPRRDTSTLFFNVEKLLAEMESTRNYYLTPAVNLVYGLNRSLKRMIEGEGLGERYRRHRVMAEAVQAAVEALGLQLVAEKPFRARTVTAVYLPRGIEWPRLYTEARRRGVELAGGLGELKGRIFRIGHMGETTVNDIAATIAVLERVLARLGYSVKLGKGLEAMQQVLDSHGY